MGEKVEYGEKQEQLVDTITDLPNDILVRILSFLPLEDAAKTSVLSKRWIDLWMYVSRLNFDAAKEFKGLKWIDDSAEYYRLRGNNHCKYVKLVDKVLQSHKAMNLDQLRIHIDLDKDSKNDIDKWIQYAFSRRVQSLDLNFRVSHLKKTLPRVLCPLEKAYTFPHDLLGLSSGNSPAVSLSDPRRMMGINSDVFSGFKFLTALNFVYLNVSEELINFFIQNCPFLENLTLEFCGGLKQLQVRGQSLALKHLKITLCELHSLTVCDTNIVSLRVLGGKSRVTQGWVDCVRVVLNNVPMLVNVLVGALPYSTIDSSANSLLSSCLTKLQHLSLLIATHTEEPVAAVSSVLPQFTKLKVLLCSVVGRREVISLDRVTCLIRACPNLEKFVLRLWWFERNPSAREHTGFKKALYSPAHCHHHLKYVELSPYYGGTAEFELVNYLVENCVALEKIVIIPGKRWSEEEKMDEAAITRNIVEQQMRELLPSHVQLRWSNYKPW